MPDHSSPRSGRLISRRTLLKSTAAGAAGAALVYGLGRGAIGEAGSSRMAGIDAAPMTCRTHPVSGDRISLLGFGCMRFPMMSNATNPGGPEIDEAGAIRLVDRAIEGGVNYFDTGYRYHGGASEVMIGKALKRHPRETFYLADKMPGVLRPSLEQAKDIFETQLARCQVEYFDYYLLHAVSDLALYKEVYEANGVLDYLLEQKASGRIRNLGWSFHGDQQMLNYLIESDISWDFGLVQLNYHDLLHEYVPQEFIVKNFNSAPAQARWVLERLQPSGLPLMIMEPLLGGRLARLNKRALTILQQVDPTASAASWAFRFAAGIPNVLTVLSGMTYMEHLEDNLRTFSPFRALDEQETATLQRALDIFLTQENIPCTACGYCMPCPYGLDIPAIFTHYNHCVDDQYIPKGVRDADYERARRAFLVGHDRSIPELRQASRCTGCNECTHHCPQRIDIPAQMARLGHFVEQLRSEG